MCSIPIELNDLRSKYVYTFINNERIYKMKNLSLTKLSLAVFVATLVSNVAFANSSPVELMPKVEDTSFTKLLEHYDENKDKILTLSELAQDKKWRLVFSKIDLNENKQINEQEFMQYIKRDSK